MLFTVSYTHLRDDEDVIYYNNFRVTEKALDSALQLEAVLEVEKSMDNA